jgi:hypothetical protein
MTHCVDPEALDQPNWFAADESLHVFAPNQRYVVAEAALIFVN